MFLGKSVTYVPGCTLVDASLSRAACRRNFLEGRSCRPILHGGNCVLPRSLLVWLLTRPVEYSGRKLCGICWKRIGNRGILRPRLPPLVEAMRTYLRSRTGFRRRHDRGGVQIDCRRAADWPNLERNPRVYRTMSTEQDSILLAPRCGRRASPSIVQCSWRSVKKER
jgi:hypothetical protein